MKKIILIGLLVALGFAQGTYMFTAYTLDKTANPFEVEPIESLLVIRYDDDGTTVIDSLYTNDWGFVLDDDAFRGDNWERVYCVKSGYTVGDNGWIRFSTVNFDTTADTLAIPLRVVSSPGDSTVTISFTLMDLDGTPNSNQRVTHYVSSPHRGTGNSILFNSSSGNFFSTKTYTSSDAGLVEITTPKYSTNGIKIGDRILTPELFDADSNMNLNNIIFDAED